MRTSLVGLKYKLIWPTRYWRAPRSFEYVLENSIAQSQVYYQDLFEEEIDVCFFGDFMGIGHKKIHIGKNLRNLMNEVDHSVINLETVLAEKDDLIIAKQYTYPSSFKSLCHQLEKNNIAFNLANNHLFDYGNEGLCSTLSTLEENGLMYFGIKDREYFRLGKGLIVDGQTLWKGHKEDITNTEFNLHQDDQVIKYIHWGEEFKKQPEQEQEDYFESSSELMVVGHHSHCPQKIIEKSGRICAYSLGNFVTAADKEKINTGIALRVKLGRMQNRWVIASSEWKFIGIKAQEDEVIVELKS